MNRLFFSIQQGHKHRLKLRSFLRASQILEQLNCHQMHQTGIEAIVFDFDGVLAHHGSDHPLPIGIHLLKTAVDEFGVNRVFILSNKPKMVRKIYFEKEFPGLHFISSSRKKPYPDGMNLIVQNTHLRPDQIILVDDRLLTGGLAAVLSGSQFCHVKNPLRDFSVRPVKEAFFHGLRTLENAWFG